jgi:hypothetical protein
MANTLLPTKNVAVALQKIKLSTVQKGEKKRTKIKEFEKKELFY